MVLRDWWHLTNEHDISRTTGKFNVLSTNNHQGTGYCDLCVVIFSLHNSKERFKWFQNSPTRTLIGDRYLSKRLKDDFAETSSDNLSARRAIYTFVRVFCSCLLSIFVQIIGYEMSSYILYRDFHTIFSCSHLFLEKTIVLVYYQAPF